MSLKSINPKQTLAWKKLQAHFDTIKDEHMSKWFSNNPNRPAEMSVEWDDFYLDFSKNRITSDTLSLLKDLVEEVQLKDAISQYFKGQKINKTEGRAVLHTALRAPKNAHVLFEGADVIPDIYDVKNKIKQFSEAVISGDRKGFTNKVFTDVVNIGIGGSDLGILYYGRKLLGLFEMPKNAIFIYFLNPLVVIELSGNLHHEGLMVFFMLLAFYHLKCKKLFHTAFFIGLSVLTKLIPLLLLPLFFPKLGRVKSLPFFGTIAGVIILGFSPFINLEFIVNYSQSVGLWFSNFEFNASIYYVLKIILKHFFELSLITYMCFIVPLIMGSTLLYFISRKQNKTRAIIIQSLWLLSAYFFISTTIHPWYLIPLVFLSCFGNYQFPLWWSFSVFLSYAAYFQNEVHENSYLLMIEYGILMAVLIYEFIVKVPRIKASSTD